MAQQPPSKYICPLTLDIMKQPVLSRWGHTFEREAIMEWLAAGNDHCPMTRKRLRPSDLISHKTLQQEILEWRRENGLSGETSGSIPSADFVCPLTKEIMSHPVVSRDGVNYERAAIVAWFNEGYDFCPLSGKPLKPSGLVPNVTLSREIQKWKKENGIDDSEDNVKETMDDYSETCCWAAVNLPGKKSIRCIRKMKLKADDRVMMVST